MSTRSRARRAMSGFRPNTTQSPLSEPDRQRHAQRGIGAVIGYADSTIEAQEDILRQHDADAEFGLPDGRHERYTPIGTEKI